MSRRLIALLATLLLASACADPAAGDPVYIIVLPDAAPDEDQTAAPDMADPLDQDAPDMEAPDQAAPEDMASPPDMDAPDQGQPADMPPESVNPCANGLTEQQRLDAWRAEVTTPDLYRLSTMDAQGRITTPNHFIDFEAQQITVTRRADSAVLMDCTLRALPQNACEMACSGPMAPPSTELFSRKNLTLDSGCFFSGVGVEPPHLSFAVSHIDYESWVWTFDMDAARLLQSMRNIGPVIIKFFEHRGQCLRLWHTRDGDSFATTITTPSFKLFDLRQGLWLPRLDATISEADFFEQAASRVAVE
jgi:hypothetical protein